MAHNSGGTEWQKETPAWRRAGGNQMADGAVAVKALRMQLHQPSQLRYGRRKDTTGERALGFYMANATRLPRQRSNNPQVLTNQDIRVHKQGAPETTQQQRNLRATAATGYDVESGNSQKHILETARTPPTLPGKTTKCQKQHQEDAAKELPSLVIFTRHTGCREGNLEGGGSCQKP